VALHILDIVFSVHVLFMIQ